MGDSLWPAQSGNPKGFFEDREVNDINESLLANVVTRRPPLLGKLLFKSRPHYPQRWLSLVPKNTEIKSTSCETSRIISLISRAPYCFKDPRFCHTLDVWRPHLKNIRFVCVFREPEVTVESMQTECRSAAYLADLRLSRNRAYKIWAANYSAVLERRRAEERWLFLHYNQVLNGSRLDALADFTGAGLDKSFVDKHLARSEGTEDPPQSCRRLYEILCQLAG